jgi:hypothetical protein
MRKLRVKLVGDGPTGHDVRVFIRYDEDDGTRTEWQEISGVSAATYEVDACSIAKVTLTFQCPAIEVVGMLEAAMDNEDHVLFHDIAEANAAEG